MKRVLIVLLLFACGAVVSLQAQAAPSPILMKRLLDHPDTGNRTYMGESFQRLSDIRAFYADRSYAAVWTRERLEQLSYAFMVAERAGLDPADYHFDALGTEYSKDNEMAIELLATDAFIALAEDLANLPDADMRLYFSHILDNHDIYNGLAELAAFRAGRP